MDRRMLFRGLGFTLSAILAAALLLASVLRAGSAQGAGAYSGEPVDYNDGMPAAAVAHWTNDQPFDVAQDRRRTTSAGITEALRNPETTGPIETAYPLSANPVPESVYSPSADSIPAGWPQARVEAALFGLSLYTVRTCASPREDTLRSARDVEQARRMSDIGGAV